MRIKLATTIILGLIVFSKDVFARDIQGDSTTIEEVQAPLKKSWFETIQLRGYAQLRYNRLFETNPNLSCEQCDRSWGENGGFFFRRI